MCRKYFKYDTLARVSSKKLVSVLQGLLINNYWRTTMMIAQHLDDNNVPWVWKSRDV